MSLNSPTAYCSPNDSLSPSSLINVELIENNATDLDGILSEITSNHQDDNDSVIADVFDDIDLEVGDNTKKEEEPIRITTTRSNVLKRILSRMDRKNVTCCSTQFSSISCFSIIALLLNILSLLAVIGLATCSNISYRKFKVIEIMSLVADSRNKHSEMGERTREVSYNTKAYVPNGVIRSFYTSAMLSLMSDLKNLSSLIPPNELKLLNSIVDSNFTSIPNSILWNNVLNMISSSSNLPSGNMTSPGPGSGQPPGPPTPGPPPPGPPPSKPGSPGSTSSVNITELLIAQKVLTSQEFSSKESDNNQVFESFLDRLIDICWDSHSNARGTLIGSLALICLSIALVIPFAVLIFLFGLINSSKEEKKLSKANTILLFETMDCPNLKPLFEKLCFSSGRKCQFIFISKTRDYTQLCKRSLELQLRTFELTQNFMKGSELIEKPNALILKQISQNESLLNEIEYMKQQVAFELIECMDTSNEMGVSLSHLNHDELIRHFDQFNNKEEDYEVLDILPVDLFERCEEEVAHSLIELHNYFKQSDEYANIISDSPTNITKL